MAEQQNENEGTPVEQQQTTTTEVKNDADGTERVVTTEHESKPVEDDD